MPSDRATRRLPSHRFVDFDDFLWPINVALTVFGLCVAGVIVAESDFRTPILVYNGWVRLGSLVAVMGLLVWGMMRLDSYWSRRMQLSVLVALIAHLWVAVYLHEQYLEMQLLASDAAAAEALEAQPIVTLPDYDFQELDQTVPDDTLDDPLAIVTPDILPPEMEREVEPSQPTEVRQTDEPARIEIENPQPAPLVRTEVAAPRRSESYSAGPLSRQELQQDFAPELIETPTLLEAPQQEETPLEPDMTTVARQASAPQLSSREPDVSPLNERTASAGDLARRSAAEAPRAETSRVAQRRSLASLDAPSEADQMIEALRSPTASRELSPQVAGTERTVGAAAAERANREPSATTSPSVSTAMQPWRGARRNDAPALNAQQPQVASRSGMAAGLPTERIAQPALGRPGERARGESSLQPAMGDLARSAATGGTSPGRQNAASRDGPGFTADTSASAMSAAPGSTAPRVATRPGSGLRRNATSGADVEVASIDNAAVRGGAAAGESNSPLEPLNTALTRASGGATGITRQNRFDADLPGGGATSNSPSASARRAMATDEDPTGQGNSPSRPSQLARARAGSELPSAALRADDVTIADTAGSSRPGEVEASSGAAVTRRASAAPRGRTTAASGSSLVDLDPGPSTAATGAGRSSGGGEPTVSSGYQPGTARRGTASAEIGSVAAIDDSALNGASGAVGSGGASPGAIGPANSGVARSGGSGSPARRGSGGGTPGLAPALGGAGGSAELSRAAGGGQRGPSIASLSGGPNGRATGAATLGGDDTAQDPLAGDAASGTNRAGNGGAGGPRGDAVSGVTRSAAGGGGLQRPGGGTGTGAAVSANAGATGTGPRRIGEAGPAVANGTGSGPGVGRATSTADVGDVDAEAVEIGPVAGEGTRGGAASGDVIGPTAEEMAPPRQTSTALVRHNAPAGVGGLGDATKLAPGVPNRRARPESEVAHNSIQRFVLERSGGTSSAIDAKADTGPVHGYRQRNPNQRGDLAEAMGGNSASERAVEMGLDFLARHQLEDGRWSLHDFAGGKPGYRNAGAGSMKTDTAATGLALLTFYGAGYTHSDGKYRLVVRRGLDHLLSNQKANGDLFVPQDQVSAANVQFYSHGIAAIALCEAYGMTRDKDLREPAQRALDFIVASQHPREGGWRYSPRGGSDTSVTGWQMMAMKSGELAGLHVPSNTYDKLRDWLDHASTPHGNPSRYAYRPRSTQQNQARPSLAMTAEGLLMQQYLGWQRDNEYLRDGAAYLQANLPSFGTPSERTRDCYYWYYATQVMFQMQGEYWTDWNEALRPLLIDSQLQDGQLAGSWDPTGSTPDRWGPLGGRMYVTCLHLLMLEVYYRHLPLYRDLNVAQASE